MLRRLPLDKIRPFDDLHEGPEPPEDHWDGIKFCQELLREGKAIRPIVVYPMGKYYQRLDGFKRYWAQKLEGRTEIDCIVIDQWWPGAQHGHPMTIEEDEWATLTASS